MNCSLIQQLMQAVNDSGHDCRCIELAGDAKLLVMRTGARALGLFPDDRADNFFWINPAWLGSSGGRSIYAGVGWPNPGGDRTWVSPEVELFISDLKDIPGTHKVPIEIDPGDYAFGRVDGQDCLTTRARVRLLHANVDMTVMITKWFAPTPNPLQQDREILQSAQFAGYRQQTHLEILDSADQPGARIDLWNLTQLPHGGWAIVPTLGERHPIVMFGQIATGDLDVNSRRVVFSMQQPGVSKIGFEPSATPGRAGYLYRSDASTWNLIVRDFSIDPSARYVDTPWWQRDQQGTCVQLCSYSVGDISFSELEYHAPSIGHDTQATRSLDDSRLWAYRGERETILRIAGRLLGVDAADHVFRR